MSDDAGGQVTMGILADLGDTENGVLPFWWFCVIITT